MTKKIKTGIIGLGCRGFSLLDTILACENAEIAAVCDVYPDRIDRAFEKICVTALTAMTSEMKF